MATLDFLPSTTYKPPVPEQAQDRGRPLNTIIEDDEESSRGSAVLMEIRYRMDSWNSPRTGQFPTPRGHHFMLAPVPSSSGDSETESESPSSAPWTRDSYTTDATEFDDLYDVSSDEDTHRKAPLPRRTAIRRQSNSSKRSSMSSTSSRQSLPALVIPMTAGVTTTTTAPDPWASVAAFKMLSSPVPPTPPPKIPMSPAIFSYLQSQEVPSCSAPPSLDGSLTSEQMANMSAPSTPDMSDNEDKDASAWGGVHLQPAALATLQALSGTDELFEQQTERVIELSRVSPNTSPVREMQQALPPLNTNIHRNDSIVLSPEQQRSLNSLTRLEIPSPGGFFSALAPNARHTWHLGPVTPESAHPPSSTTACNFYRTPWSSVPVERIIEVPEMSETMSDGFPTARPSTARLNDNLPTPRPPPMREDSGDTITGLETSPVEEIIEVDHETKYAQLLEAGAAINKDRTGEWLAAQKVYLEALVNPTEARDDEVALLKRASTIRVQKRALTRGEVPPSPPPTGRKTVRFSEVIWSGDAPAATSNSGELACPLPTPGRQESAYYRAFKDYLARTRTCDTFVHRTPRFEALQAQRVSFPAMHRAQLLGKYQLSVIPMSAKRRLSANVVRGDDFTPEDPVKLKRDREYEAYTQMASATWNVMAYKLLNGGRLIATPVAKRLARLSAMGPTASGAPRDRARILDLGGQATCDWAWHCAMTYPNTKIYTVTTKSLRQLSNSNIRGPRNHRQVAVSKLVRLPFRDSSFDLVSAREIHSMLRANGEHGEDEWTSCLAECMRVLKPGGYLEFSIMDSDIVNAGPRGLAKSVEFGFNLTTLGYDPEPTRAWLRRLNNAGFCGVQRAWMFMPMGAKIHNPTSPAPSSTSQTPGLEEAQSELTGSTDAAACITGVVGGWAWEKWLLRTRVQTAALQQGDSNVGEKSEANTDLCGLEYGAVQDIVEEGRACGAGWRLLTGWARKPLY